MHFPNTVIQFEEFRKEDVPIELVLNKFDITNNNKHLSMKEVPDAQDINFLIVEHPIKGIELFYVTPVMSHMLTESRLDLYNASYLENINPYLRNIINNGNSETKSIIKNIMKGRRDIFNEILNFEDNYNTLINLFLKFDTSCMFIKACIYGNEDIDDEIFPICPGGYKKGYTIGIYDVYDVDITDTDIETIVDSFKSNTSPCQWDNITYKRESDLSLARKYGYDKNVIKDTEEFLNFYNKINLLKSSSVMNNEKFNDNVKLIPICFILTNIKFPLPKIDDDYKFISSLIQLESLESLESLCEYNKYIKEIRVYQVTNTSLVLDNNDYNYMYSSLTYEDINKEGYELIIENLLRITGELEEKSDEKEVIDDE